MVLKRKRKYGHRYSGYEELSQLLKGNNLAGQIGGVTSALGVMGGSWVNALNPSTSLFDSNLQNYDNYIGNNSNQNYVVNSPASAQFKKISDDNLETYSYEDNPLRLSTGSHVTDLFKQAGAGAAAGSAIAPGIGTAIGAGVGLLSGIGSWIAGDTKAENERLKYNAAVLQKKKEIELANILNFYNFGDAVKDYEFRLFISKGKNIAAKGGNILTMANGLTFFGTGGTHELNSLGGIQLGIAPDGLPNLVEEGEVKWDMDSNKLNIAGKNGLFAGGGLNEDGGYIFSNRIMMPDEKTTVAEHVVKILKEASERPFDKISNDTLHDKLNEAYEYLENKRLEELMNNMKKFAKGGHMYYYGDFLNKFNSLNTLPNDESRLEKLLRLLQGARDMRIGAVGALQVRDLYNQGEIEAAQKLASDLVAANAASATAPLLDAMIPVTTISPATTSGLPVATGAMGPSTSLATRTGSLLIKGLNFTMGASRVAPGVTISRAPQAAAQAAAQAANGVSEYIIPAAIGTGLTGAGLLTGALVDNQNDNNIPLVSNQLGSNDDIVYGITSHTDPFGRVSMPGVADPYVSSIKNSAAEKLRAVINGGTGVKEEDPLLPPPPAAWSGGISQPKYTFVNQNDKLLGKNNMESIQDFQEKHPISLDLSLPGKVDSLISDKQFKELNTNYYKWRKQKEAEELFRRNPLEYLRYAPVLGAAIDYFNHRNDKPDYSVTADLEKAIRDANNNKVKANIVGNYLSFRALPILLALNQLAAEERAQEANAYNSMANPYAAENAANVIRNNMTDKYGNALISAFAQDLAGFNEVLKNNNLIHEANRDAALKADIANAQQGERAMNLSANLAALKWLILNDFNNRLLAYRSNFRLNLGNLGTDIFNRNDARWLANNGVFEGFTPRVRLGSVVGAKGGRIKTKLKHGLTY